MTTEVDSLRPGGEPRCLAILARRCTRRWGCGSEGRPQDLVFLEVAHPDYELSLRSEAHVGVEVGPEKGAREMWLAGSSCGP